MDPKTRAAAIVPSIIISHHNEATRKYYELNQYRNRRISAQMRAHAAVNVLIHQSPVLKNPSVLKCNIHIPIAVKQWRYVCNERSSTTTGKASRALRHTQQQQNWILTKSPSSKSPSTELESHNLPLQQTDNTKSQYYNSQSTNALVVADTDTRRLNNLKSLAPILLSQLYWRYYHKISTIDLSNQGE